MPELSIIMPLYNTEKYVGQAVQSLLSQSYTDFELIIVDDASTDGSFDVVKSLKDNRIKILTNDRNHGIVFSRNRGLIDAVGRFIAPFDSDDIALPDKFMKQIRFLKDHPEYGMLGSWIRMIDEKGNLLKKGWSLKASPEQIPSQLLFRNYFAQLSVVIRREAIPQGGYVEGYNMAEDYRMWIEVARNFKVWNYPEYLVYYRIHPGSVTDGNTERLNQYESKVFEYSFKFLDIQIDQNHASLLHLINNDDNILEIGKLKQIEEFLLLILNKNAIRRVYDQDQLIKVVLNRWIKACYKSRGMNVKTVNQFLTSPLWKFYFTNKNDKHIISSWIC